MNLPESHSDDRGGKAGSGRKVDGLSEPGGWSVEVNPGERETFLPDYYLRSNYFTSYPVLPIVRSISKFLIISNSVQLNMMHEIIIISKCND